MSELLDEYLTHLQEGVWSAIRKALEFPTAKHPKYKLLIKSLNNRHIMCRSDFPANDTRVDLNTPWGEVKYGDYVEHPEYSTCLNKAYADFSKDFLKWVAKEKVKGVCRYNRNFERCSKWVEREVLENKEDLKNIMRQLEIMKKGRRLPKNQYEKLIKALYKKG